MYKMSNSDPINYSNQYSTCLDDYIDITIFLISAICSILLGIYLASFNQDWWVMLFFVPIAIVLGFFAYRFYPMERKVVYSYTVTTDGIHEIWKNNQNGKEDESFISFND